MQIAVPSLLLKIGSSWVNGEEMSNVLLIELSGSVRESIYALLDVWSNYHHTLPVIGQQESNDRLILHGFHKQLFDTLILRQGIRSRVVLDPYRERIYFHDAQVVLEKVHRREKALYALILLETPSGGVNFTKPSVPGYQERYARRMKALQEKYRIIYKMFGGDPAKAPNLSVAESRMPMLSLLKRQILCLKDVLEQVEDYTIQRNVFGCYAVGLSPDMCCCCDCDGATMESLQENGVWRSIAVL